MRRTLIACAVVALGFGALASAATRRFESWTFEEQRREDARLGKLQAPPVPLRTARGEMLMPWSPGDAGSEVYLVDFVYTRCLSVCQALGSAFGQAQAELDAAPDARVKLLSLSFDIGRDDQAALAAYARLHQVLPRHWAVAAPETSDDAKRLLGQLGVIAIEDGQGGYVHNGTIHLIDARGTVHGIYDLAAWREALADARRLTAAP